MKVIIILFMFNIYENEQLLVRHSIVVPLLNDLH